MGNALAPYVNSLVLPNAGAWFRATFGQEIGGELADSYDRTRMNLPLSFPDTLRQIESKHLSHARAVQFTDSCNADATEAEYQVLISRTKDHPLYDIRFTSSSTGVVLPYFTYVDGAFRYIGNFDLRVPATRMVQVDGKVIAKTLKILRQAVPVYPQDAKINHIQGKVLLHAIIGENGQVCSLHLIRGDSLLAASSMAAVRQWRYTPYILNGKPVSVDTTITVIFNLGN
jgi:TonB family protein